jgi:streptomycin 6-kinase
LHLPQVFTEKILLVFGEKGRAWLEQIPQVLARCQDRWRLTNIRLVGELSYNLVCFAESPVYGAVALKIGVPNPELVTEMKVLSLYAGRSMCACYDADVELGALLLERIVPGSDLTDVGNSEERFRIAAGLFVALPVALEGDHGFPSYGDWISRAFKRARAENRVGLELLSLVDEAERFFQEIDTPDRPRLLLHGDLHHKNILQDRQGGWKAIDPKGVIGVPCFGAARFMQNEFRMGARADRFDRLDQMTTIFAVHLGERKQLLAKCAFVEHVLATCWSAEENEAPESLRTAVEECTALLGYSLRME